MPADLKELSTAIQTYERLIGDIHRMEKTFPPITDQMVILGKYIEISVTMYTWSSRDQDFKSDYLNFIKNLIINCIGEEINVIV